MAIPLIGVSVLAGFGYMMFDAQPPSKPNSTPGAVQHNTIANSDDAHKDVLQTSHRVSTTYQFFDQRIRTVSKFFGA